MLGLGDNLIEVPELVGIVDLLCVVGGASSMSWGMMVRVCVSVSRKASCSSVRSVLDS